MARGDYLREVLESGVCPRCQQKKDDIDEQYSYGVYAGVMCTDCAIRGFNDACGHRPEGQGDPNELDEPYWEEDPSDLTDDGGW
jgi:hypothetical protein